METSLFGFVFLVFCAGLSYGYHKETVGCWSYEGRFGPDRWKNVKLENNECGKSHQSPINIISKTAKQSSRELSMANHNATFTKSTLLNNGHNANLILNYQSIDNKPVLKINFANGTVARYDFNSLHFHFGRFSDHGSEHQIDEKMFPMEMHSIYFRPEYDTFAKALKHSDGVIVLATLYEMVPEEEIDEDDEENALSSITSKLAEVIHPNTNTTISEIYLQGLFPKNLHGYYKYHGSLTTPPCSQAVTWYILKEKFPVTECQLDQFRHLLKKDIDEEDDHDDDANYVADNVRPIQPLNNRYLYTHS